MDKRAFLKTLSGRAATTATAGTSIATLGGTNLDPYTGVWDFEQAAHLLRRTTYGPSKTQINQAVQDGLEATLDRLFSVQALPDPPIYYDFIRDPNVPNGETWVETPPDQSVGGLLGARRRSLVAWFIGLMNEGGINIREKMVMFWHNHFAINNINRAQFTYYYLNDIRENSLGNLRTLLEKMTVAPAMLTFLNGNQNTVQAPNENYSRELLELFSVGRGDVAGPGDYTNYTEQDVAEMARALTGWRTVARDNGAIESTFVPNRHDTTDKQLSPRFNNQIIADGGENEYKELIDIILQQDEVARFICRQLHIWFVSSTITPDIETNIIEPMAQIMIDDNYEVGAAVRALMCSEYFYDEAIRGCMINHPYDFLFKMVNTFELELPPLINTKYAVWNSFARVMELHQMTLTNLPSVAGWQAFYQEPQYYQFWINSVTLPLRQDLTNFMIDGFRAGDSDNRLKLDLLNFISKLDNPLDPNALIDESSEILFVFPLAQNQKDFLKEVLIPGLPDFEWTVEYGDYLSDPDDDALRNAVTSKLEALFSTILNMPEFYLT